MRERFGDAIFQEHPTRRIDFAFCRLQALTDDSLIREAPALVGRQSPSALELAAKPL